jgi:hypothetical protein
MRTYLASNVVHLWFLWTLGLHKRRGIQWPVTDFQINGENSVNMTDSFHPPAPLALCANALALCRIQVKWLAPKRLLSSFLGSLRQHRRYFKKLVLTFRCDQLSYVLVLWKAQGHLCQTPRIEEHSQDTSNWIRIDIYRYTDTSNLMIWKLTKNNSEVIEILFTKTITTGARTSWNSVH